MWSTTALFAGCFIPLGKHIEFNPYYEHQNDTSKRIHRLELGQLSSLASDTRRIFGDQVLSILPSRFLRLESELQSPKPTCRF
jgi:hypothetical protein